MKKLIETINRVQPLDAGWIMQAEARQRQLTKPPGSLGRLEGLASRLCAIQQTIRPQASPRCIVIFAADHGVTAEAISQYPPEVTRQMVANFRLGGAAINALAGTAGADVQVVDIGVAGDAESSPLADQCDGTSSSRGNNADDAVRSSHVSFIKRHVSERGGPTRNIRREAAMSEAEMLSALKVGIELAEQAAHSQVKLIGLGEMGIGNTTSASAVTAALTGLEPATVTGRGTGADDATFARKLSTVQDALIVNTPRREDALDVLGKVGGFEIAGLCGLCLGAATERLAIITDGFIATAGAALAVRLCPAVADYIFAAHLSPEPGHAALLNLINQSPILNLEMRLGEGTGAALAMPIIAAAVAAFNEMATFTEAGVSTDEDMLKPEEDEAAPVAGESRRPGHHAAATSSKG